MRAVALATALATWLVALPASAHTFPPARNVVVQVERCAVVLFVGYRPGSGEPTETILSRVAIAPKSHTLEALREVLTAFAMAPLTVAVDGHALVPSSVEAKIGVEPGGARPMVVVLVTFPLPAGKALSVTTKDPRSTRISWQDRRSDRVPISDAPAQGRWFSGVASFLLPLAQGASTCASYRSSRSDSSSAPAR